MNIHHHTGLQMRGGAVRVAELVGRVLSEAGHGCSSSFECAETKDAPALTPPEQTAQAVPDGGILHVHSTADWVRLLSAVPEEMPTLITLHDCDLFTGGCPYPLTCENFNVLCAEPCPRNYQECAGYREAKKLLVDKLNPVLVSPSGWLAGLARKALPGHSIKVIPNGVPWPENPPDKKAARQALGIHPAARVAIFVAHGGEMAAYKSGDRWQELWDKLHSRVPRLVGFAAGGDHTGEKNGLHMWPYLDRERMLQLMAAADVLLYPSLADNHPLVVLEGMGMGLAAVAFAAGGIPEQVRHNETGLLVAERDFNAFVESAASLLNRDRMVRDMGMAAFFDGKKRFCHTRMGNDYLKLYDKISGDDE